MKWRKELVDSVWEQGRVMLEADASTWRQDACGAWIRRDQFDREESEFGWRIEKLSGAAPNAPENFRPFHWRNRFDVANNRPHCAVTADRSGVAAGEYASPPCNRAV